MSDPEAPKRRQPALIAVIALLIVAAAAIVIVIALNAGGAPGNGQNPDSSAYAAELAEAMANADAESGEALIYEFECYTCHVLGDGSLSPFFDGIGLLAAERRPPLNAEQYLYEAIVYPSAFLLEDYSDSMPGDYGERVSPGQIGDMIAYLLSLTEPLAES